MNLLLTTDLHLTARPEHAYRLQYLAWLCDVVRNHKIDAVVICGDLADAKDNHPGVLVNAVALRLEHLTRFCPVHILRGNHDGPTPDQPYWDFLRFIPGIHYHSTFDIVDFGGKSAYAVPFGYEERLLHGLENGGKPDMVFMHATVNGARTENGTKLDAPLSSKFLPTALRGRVDVFSGDIHVPQVIGDVTYIGCPYHVHFGDSYQPRLLKYDTKLRSAEPLHYHDAPRLLTVRMHLERSGAWFKDVESLRPNDRIKVVAEVETEVLPQDWQNFVKGIRQIISSAGAELVGATMERTAPPGARTRIAPNVRRSDEAIVRTYGDQQHYAYEIIKAGVGFTQ